MWTEKPEPPTNTGVGMNVSEYLLKRRLLFDGLKQGGLERTPDHKPIYRVIFQVPNAPDWGRAAGRCLWCKTVGGVTRGRAEWAAETIFSLVHSGGFDAGATWASLIPWPRDAQSARSAGGGVENSPRNIPAPVGIPGRVERKPPC